MNNRIVLIIFAMLAIGAFSAFGAPADPAGMLLMTAAPVTISAEQWKELSQEVHGAMARLKDGFTDLKDRMRDVEQKADRRPGAGAEISGGASEFAKVLGESGGMQAFLNGTSKSVDIKVPRDAFQAAAISGPGTSTTGTVPILYPADRRPGIVAAPERRLAIRDLFNAVPTESGLVEFAQESAFTNNAGPQYDGSSPTAGTEGAVKPESAFAFTLSQVAVATIAHWVPVSRQILADAPRLQNFISERLIYGLKLKEEDGLLNGSGASGQLNGLITQATAFTGGATNQTALDTLAKAIVQLALANYEASGIILNPSDWLSIQLLKDSQGRYLLGNPAEMTRPQLWGIPVVPTNSLAAGNFVALDAARTGYIADREDVNVRIAEQHADFFIRNMAAMLCEERVALVVERPAGIIYGALSYAG